MKKGFSQPRLSAPVSSLRWLKFIRRVFLFIVAGLLGSNLPVWAQSGVLQEISPPTSVEESVVPTDFTFTKPLERIAPAHPLRERIKEQMKELPPFLRDTKLDVLPRTYYFLRDKYDNTKSEAWAIGGALVYKSGYLFEHLAVGAVGYTSDHLYAPPDRDGTLLLKPGQKNINVLGQLYAEVKVTEDFVINAFRKEYDTPYINKNDSRMIPNTFEAYAFRAKLGGKDGALGFRFGGGYFTRVKERESSQFIPMSQAAGVRADRGVSVGGGIFEMKNFSLAALNYFCQDLINIFYTESKFTFTLKNGLGFQLAGQFTDQESNGGNLLMNRPFSTRQFGFKGGISYQGALLNLAFTQNAIGGTDLQYPWSSYPGYTSVQVSDFNRAGEKAFMIMGTYNLARLGLEGVTAYGLWVHGWGRVDPLTRVSVYNEDEYDFDLQWKPKSSFMKGFWLRLRYALVEQRGGKEQILHEHEFRTILNYDFSLL